MTQFRIKRVYEPASPEDGFRVLVDRLWPRGMRREALRLDLWARELTPSDGLRRWYHADPEGRRKEFRRLYEAELHDSGAVRAFVLRVAEQKVVTLLHASSQSAGSHVSVLREALLRAASEVPAGTGR